MATLIKADETSTEVKPKNNKKHFSLEELQKFVGGYIQIANTTDGRLMIMNEEGRLNGLPFNKIATDLYRNSVIVGDVLVCKQNEVK